MHERRGQPRLDQVPVQARLGPGRSAAGRRRAGLHRGQRPAARAVSPSTGSRPSRRSRRAHSTRPPGSAPTPLSIPPGRRSSPATSSCATPAERSLVRGHERQTSIYVAGVSGRRPRVPTDATMLEERAREAMRREAFAYVAGGRRDRGHDAGEPRAPSIAGGSCRGCCATCPSATRASSCSAARFPRPFLRRADRRARDGPPRGRARGGARRARRGRADGLLEPGLGADGGGVRRSSATRRAGSSSTGAPATSSWRASCAGPRRAAARRSS